MTRRRGPSEEEAADGKPYGVTEPRRGSARGPGILRTVVEAVLTAVLVSVFGVTTVGISGDSMTPTLLDGERAVVPRYETWLHRLGVGAFEPGDIVYFPSPRDRGTPLLRTLLIKRIVAEAGDSVEIRGGRLVVNGVEVDESYLDSGWHGTSGMSATVVPDGHVFVLGDNRSPLGSVDSRQFGPVPLASIAGRATAVVWPIWRRGVSGTPWNVRRLVRPDSLR